MRGFTLNSGAQGEKSTGNTTTTPLGSGATFTGDWELTSLPDVGVSCKADVAGTLYFDFSNDRTNVDTFPVSGFVCSAGVHEFHTAVKLGRWFRVRYINGSSAQSSFRVHSYYGTFQKGNAPLNQTLSDDADAIVVKSVSEELLIAEGKYSNRAIVNKFGRVADVAVGTGTGDAPVDLWEGSDDYTGFPVTSSETVDVSSTSTADDDGDTGANTIQIYGLDANWAEQNEIITMNGTSKVTSSGTYRRVNRVIVRSAGSGGANAGVITVQHTTTTANIFAKVQIGANQSQIAAYTIPAGKTGYVRKIYASLIRAGGAQFDRDADLALLARPTGEVFQVKRPFGVSNALGYNEDIFGGLPYAAQTDIKLRILAVSNTTTISGGFDIILVDS